MRAALRLCKGGNDCAQELVQEALVKGYEAFRKGMFREGYSPQAWLTRIEDENAGELTPERIAQMESAGTPEGADDVLEETGAARDGGSAPKGAPPVLVTGRRFKRAN